MASVKSTCGALLKGVAWLLFGAGGVSFWVGGRALHEFAKIDRVLAEMEGIGFAAVCFVLGVVAKSVAEDLDDPEEDKGSGNESSQK